MKLKLRGRMLFGLGDEMVSGEVISDSSLWTLDTYIRFLVRRELNMKIM